MASFPTDGLNQGDSTLLNVLYSHETTDILTILGSGGGGGSPDLSDYTTTVVLTALLADKLNKSSVLTNVPANALFMDTLYTHPSQHSISMITGLQTPLDATTMQDANMFTP